VDHRSGDHRSGVQDTRTALMREVDDRRDGPPRQCRSELTITISDDSDNTVRPNAGASGCLRGVPSPLIAVLRYHPRVSTGAGEPSTRTLVGGNPRRTSPSPDGNFPVRDRVREVWESRFQVGNPNMSLPRPEEPKHPLPRRAEGRNVSASASVVSNVGNVDHILGKDVLPKSVVRSDVPKYRLLELMITDCL